MSNASLKGCDGRRGGEDGSADARGREARRGESSVRCGKQPRSRRGPRSASGDNCDRESRRGNAPDDRPRRAIRIELARVLNISHAETSPAVASRETDRARVRAAGKKGPRYLGFYPAKTLTTMVRSVGLLSTFLSLPMTRP
jgi:hypothetical protein